MCVMAIAVLLLVGGDARQGRYGSSVTLDPIHDSMVRSYLRSKMLGLALKPP